MRRTVGLVVFGLAVMVLTLAVTVSWMQDKAIVQEERVTRVETATSPEGLKCYALDGPTLVERTPCVPPPDTFFDAQGILHRMPWMNNATPKGDHP